MNIKSIRLQNNFDFLRVFAALCITFTHCYNLTANNEREPLIALTGSFDFSFIGLSVFFTISGYLIAKSAANSVSIKNFIWKRFLRIQPMLIFLCICTVFIIGPLFTMLSQNEYFLNPETWTYFRNIMPMFGVQFFLPQVFFSHPDTGVNGSLWTLVLEERLYVIIGIFMFAKTYTRNTFLVFMLLLNLLFLAHYVLFAAQLIPYLSTYPIQFAMMFLNAAAFYHLKIPFQNKGLVIFILGSVILAPLLFFQSLIYLWVLIIPFVILGFAYTKSFLNKTGYFGDFTYGIYIFSFPVQQAFIANLGVDIEPVHLFLYTLMVVLPVSVASWHLLEKRCLEYKNLIA